MTYFSLYQSNDYENEPCWLGDFESEEEANYCKSYYKEKYGLKEEDFEIYEMDDEDC